MGKGVVYTLDGHDLTCLWARAVAVSVTYRACASLRGIRFSISGYDRASLWSSFQAAASSAGVKDLRERMRVQVFTSDPAV